MNSSLFRTLQEDAPWHKVVSLCIHEHRRKFEYMLKGITTKPFNTTTVYDCAAQLKTTQKLYIPS